MTKSVISRCSRWLCRRARLKSGLGAVSGWLDRLAGPAPQGRTEICMPDGLWMRFDPREFVGRHLYWTADYDPKIWAILFRNLRRGDRVIEVGAHCGTYGLRIGRRIGSQGRVVLVEPNPGLTPDLEWAIKRNDLPQVIVEPSAVGSEDGHAELLFSGAESVTATLRKESVRGDGPTRRVAVAVVTLGTVIRRAGLGRVDVLKIDAEGLDEEIVRQATELDPRPRCIVFEQHHGGGVDVWSCRTVQRLRERGYVVRAIAKRILRLSFLEDGTFVPKTCYDFVATQEP